MGTRLRKAAVPVLAAAGVFAVLGGSSGAEGLAPQAFQGVGPTTSVGYSAKGGSTIQTCTSDTCSVGVTAPLVIKTPTSAVSYRALVSVSLDYVAVGSASNLFSLELAAYEPSTARVVEALPAKRHVGPGRGSTTLDFWVPNMLPGRTYAFSLNPTVWPKPPRGAESPPYLNTYRVVTTVDLFASGVPAR